MAEPLDDGWRILVAGTEVGTIGEAPSFEEATELLARALGYEAAARPPLLVSPPRLAGGARPERAF